MNFWEHLVYRAAARFGTIVAALVLTAVLTGAALAQSGAPERLIDPNVASEKELLALPPLNPAIVKGILEHRPFKTAIEIDAFLKQSLSQEQLTALYGKMFVHINLNAATREEMLLIPGVGNRMVREFFEYRPWKTYEQFRREIGKYVDSKEVARLERYVAIP